MPPGSLAVGIRATRVECRLSTRIRRQTKCLPGACGGGFATRSGRHNPRAWGELTWDPAWLGRASME